MVLQYSSWFELKKRVAWRLRFRKIPQEQEVLRRGLCWSITLWKAVDRRITICRGSNHHIRAKISFLVSGWSPPRLEPRKIWEAWIEDYWLIWFSVQIETISGRNRNIESWWSASKFFIRLPIETSIAVTFRAPCYQAAHYGCTVTVI